MPGLLQTPEGRFRSAKFVYALLAEAIGVLLFTFAATASVSPQQTAPWAPWGNGIALALSVYITANISGGHVNPAVTLAAMLTGHISIVKGLAFIIFQISGACLGTLMIAGLVPGSYVGMGNHGTGCFTTAPGVSLGMLFGWKAVMTFVLVSVVYAVAIGDPSFGAMGPLAIGLSLLAMVFAGQPIACCLGLGSALPCPALPCPALPCPALPCHLNVHDPPAQIHPQCKQCWLTKL
ncbi:TPA: hypothetical protein ACH3X3_003608 [Trebouxia sp. C0006]